MQSQQYSELLNQFALLQCGVEMALKVKLNGDFKMLQYCCRFQVCIYVCTHIQNNLLGEFQLLRHSRILETLKDNTGKYC